MNEPTPKITPRTLLLKPRDWQQIAQRQATDMLGTPEAAEKLAEARRYGALADELEHLQSCMRQMAGLFGVPSASPAELVALVRRAIADRDDALAAESIAQLAAEAPRQLLTDEQIQACWVSGVVGPFEFARAIERACAGSNEPGQPGSSY